MYDVIIVGAGPAGLTAAIYLRKASKKVLILEAKNYGGQIINALNVENYPSYNHISGYELATKIYNQVLNLKTEILYEKVIDIKNYDDNKEVVTDKNTYKANAIILATGSDNRKLNLENEEKLIGKGISYCATCDGPFYKNKEIAVVGGGNTAIEEAFYLSNIAKKVYIIYRKKEFNKEIFLANEILKKENIEVIFNNNITKLIGDEKLEKIEITDSDNKKRLIEISALFVAIGRIPENQNFSNLIDLDEKGYIIANEDCKTNIPGIFVAGDNRKKVLRQLVTATSDGATAAISAINYINKK